jgi:hypothetical protein
MPRTKLSRIDRDALERALELARAVSEAERTRFDAIETRDGWQEAAERAAYSRQVRNLRLKPWQCPPCDCRSDEVGLGYGNSRGEVLLRRRMLKAKISLYEPDPIAALEKIAAGAPLESTGDLKEKNAPEHRVPGA